MYPEVLRSDSFVPGCLMRAAVPAAFGQYNPIELPYCSNYLFITQSWMYIQEKKLQNLYEEMQRLVAVLVQGAHVVYSDSCMSENIITLMSVQSHLRNDCLQIESFPRKNKMRKPNACNTCRSQRP